MLALGNVRGIMRNTILSPQKGRLSLNCPFRTHLYNAFIPKVMTWAEISCPARAAGTKLMINLWLQLNLTTLTVRTGLVYGGSSGILQQLFSPTVAFQYFKKGLANSKFVPPSQISIPQMFSPSLISETSGFSVVFVKPARIPKLLWRLLTALLYQHVITELSPGKSFILLPMPA